MLKKQADKLFKYEPNSKMNWGYWEYDIDDREKLPLQKAYQKARQARFEHGEKPII